MIIGKEPGGICEESASTPSPSDIQTYKGFLASVANAMKGPSIKIRKACSRQCGLTSKSVRKE
ncbi:hypothetical protein I7I50_04831 [Histoplasma capsulatum G186AR]|uniref:Uncharacterized protein n=1 Tax=Ajellomyces capsulatus TaxID=5037 RepID=A0A8H8D9K7_AJECA|nr:hypothetical protein I7I52_03093 [Histoplasma capsulatum]QSS75638.1 hypothetical protein I7I50_04831 [Histoplasma capsulatum G186AR]